jgi:hypothetical protein
VHLVRQALDVDEEDVVLTTVRGRGYRIDAPVAVIDPHAQPERGATPPPHEGAEVPRRLRIRVPLAFFGVAVLCLLLFLGRPIRVDASVGRMSRVSASGPGRGLMSIPFGVPGGGRPSASRGNRWSTVLIA